MWGIIDMTLALCVAALSAALWYTILARRYRHATKFDLGHMTEMDELQLPIADSAFYLSYFYDMVRAPSISDGIARLLLDPRSEAPDVINAVHKFNVAPEMAVAIAHHLLRQTTAAPSPFVMYVHTVFAWSGLGVFALATTAWIVGGGLLTSAAAASLFLSLCFGPSMSSGIRIFSIHSMALREHWGTPAMLLQTGCLSAWLRWSSSKKMLLAYVAATAVFEVCWQFAPFVLVLQMCSLLGAHLLAGLSRSKVGEAAVAAVLGTMGALVASFGNRMLLCSPFFALAVSMAVIGNMPLPAKVMPTGSLLEAVIVLGLALTCGALGQQLIVWFASEQEDSHVLQLLLQKLGLAPENSSFDAFLYLQASEFGFIQKEHLQEALRCGALPGAAFVAILVMAVACWRSLRGTPSSSTSSASGGRGKKEGEAKKSNSKKPKVESQEARLQKPPAEAGAAAGSDDPMAAWVSLVLFLCALLVLAALVNRLRVLAAPVLCLVAALTASPKLWGLILPRYGAWLVAHVLGILLIAVPPYQTGAIKRAYTVGEHAGDADMRELVVWANSSLPAGALFMADMTMAAKFRLISPTVRVGNHPQYESLTSRQRNKAYYRTFTCASPARVHSVLSSYSVTHILLNANACRARMGKLDAFHDAEDQCRSSPIPELQARTFCWGGFLSDRRTHFRMVFRNAIYTVLELQPQEATASSGVTTSASASATGGRVSSIDSWQPWLADIEGRLAARALAHAAVKWNKIFGGGGDLPQQLVKHAEGISPQDSIILLQKALLLEQLNRGQAGAGDTVYADAVSVALQHATTEPADLLDVFEARKQWLIKQGAKVGLPTLQQIVKGLKRYLVAMHRTFDLCDLAGWLSDWGQKKLGAKLWAHARNGSQYDQCVREDWVRWETSPLPELWRAFLGNVVSGS